MDRCGRDRRGRAGRRADRRAVRPVPFPPRSHVRRKAAIGTARAIRRPFGTMTANVPNDSNGSNDCVLVIIGASGDLTHRKLLPAVYNLAEAGHLPTGFAILGVARNPEGEEQFRSEMRATVEKEEGEPLEEDKWQWVAERLHY